MAYMFYLDKMLLPIAPSKLQLKIDNQNKTLTLINEGEINILKKAGLTSVEFDALIPNVKYPFAIYKSGFQKAKIFLDKLESLKVSKEPFQFIVTREDPNGSSLYGTNLKVSLEDYTIKEDDKQGFDVVISIKLKQYRDFGTKTCNITFASEKPNAKVQQAVQPARASNPQKIGIGSNVIVNGRLHRDSYGNGAGQTRTNFRGKVNFINMKGSHPYHVTTPDGGWLGWVTASSIQGV